MFQFDGLVSVEEGDKAREFKVGMKFLLTCAHNLCMYMVRIVEPLLKDTSLIWTDSSILLCTNQPLK